MVNRYKQLEQLLKKDERITSTENTLLKNEIVNLSNHLDSKLLKLLLSDKDISNMFFEDIDGVKVFDKQEFNWVINSKEFLPDSYTIFSNSIGLIDSNNSFIKKRDDITLSFPNKDCFLEFDSTKEDEDRKEIFFNEILAKNEIDVLKDPKVFVNARRYDSNGEQTVETFDENDNLIINGNNLLAMYSLLPRYKGQIKLMYWDILYNTNNDIVPYHDSFKHSSWLVMMKNRLEVAQKLLKNEGVICLQCDDNEQAYLTVLCDEVFGRNNHINTICVKMSELKGFKMGNLNNKYPKLKEYILIYGNNKDLVKMDIERIGKQNLDTYTHYYNKRIVNIKAKPEKWILESVNDNYDKISHANEMIYLVTRDSKSPVDLPVGKFTRIKDKNGKSTILLNDGTKVYTALFLSDYMEEPIGDIWTDISTININKESTVQLPNGKKPERLLKRIISSLSAEGDIVLDAYFGTGTTGAVALKLNRKFIGIEQLDNHIKKCTTRIKEVIDGDLSGISKEVNWEGGGSFTYMELAKNNMNYIDKVQTSKDKNLINIYNELLNNDFLNYRIDKELLKNNTDNFKKLDYNSQRNILLKLLDKNLLYVNYSDINDESYNISDATKKFNESYYKN